MRVRPEQLAAHLEKGLAPIYLVSGDEPLQTDEALDAIRAAARSQGYSEREVLQVEANFDWNRLASAGQSLSLFAERRLLELRLPSAKPGTEGAKALSAYAAEPPEDTLLLIGCGKLDKRQQQGKWFKALEGAGAVVQTWPVEHRALPQWVAQRMQARGLQPTPEAAQLLAERVEGNLLAAAQEIDKLVLLLGSGAVDAEAVEAAVADSARYTVFELADAALAGDATRTARVFAGLRGEGVEPVLILWALSREVRALAEMAAARERGEAEGALFAQHRVWEKRKPLVRAGLSRYPAVRWRQLLYRCGRIDRVIKGAEPGSAPDELLQLALLIAGVRVV